MKNFKCPTCQQLVAWVSTNAFRPFCSERCRLIDLGAWADGSYAVPAHEVPETIFKDQNGLQYSEE